MEYDTELDKVIMKLWNFYNRYENECESAEEDLLEWEIASDDFKF